jgi:hypothetical protein
VVVQYITNIVEVRHPSYLSSLLDWRKWRICYNGGEYFRKLYLQKFTAREDEPDFQNRLNMTPIPTYARVAINDVRNAIFQRLKDTTRRGGSAAYQRAVNGLDLGVDLRGNTMNGFLGIKVLTELLIMGRVGVYVDSPLVPGNATLADVQNYRPYLYFYPIEDILSWTCSKPDEPSTFQALLLRDVVLNFDQRTYLPTTTVERFRMLWIDRDTGRVNLQFLDTSGNPIDRDGNPAGAVELELTRIPFVLLDIGDSMIKDVVNHQIALLNLVSSDVNYALKSNFPFYVEQRDQRATGSHLKNAVGEDGTATTGGQPGADSDIKVGTTQGRTYDLKANQPAFINPSSEPLKASMGLQAKLEDDIRKLIHLAVADTANRATAESKSMDNQGLEAGLSYIGLVLEAAERQIAEFWAAYEERETAKRDIATVKYPDRYSLKTDSDRIAEAQSLVKLMYAVPGQKVKRELAKNIVLALLGGKISVNDIQAIFDEIDKAPYATSDPTTIIAAVEAGLCGEKTGSMALGFNDDEHIQARADHAARAIRILQAQQKGGQLGSQTTGSTSRDPATERLAGSESTALNEIAGDMNSDAGARGVSDLSANRSAGKEEKAVSRDTTLKDTTKPPVRGQGKRNQQEEK